MDLSLESANNALKTFEDFDVIFKEGEKAEFIYVVSEGTIACVKENKGRITPVLTAKEKSVIGLESLSYKGKYIYSAVARGTCKVVPIEYSLLKDFFEESPEIMQDLLNTLMEKVGHTTDLLTEHRIVDDSLYDNEMLSDDDETDFRRVLSK